MSLTRAIRSLLKKRHFRLPLPSAAKDILFAAALFGAVMWYSAGWLGPGLPPMDFPGTVATVQGLSGPQEKAVSAQWSDQWACGTPTAPLVSNLLWPAAFLPFMSGNDATGAVKLGGLLLLAFAAMGAYVFLRMTVHNRWASFCGGLLFAIHPVAMSVVASTGHVNFTPLYAATPLVFIAFAVYARKPSLLTLLAAAAADCILLWIDNERGAIVTLFAFGFYVVVYLSQFRKRTGISSSVKAWMGAGTGAALLAAFTAWAAAGLAIPAYVASKGLSLFTEGEKVSTITLFGLNNPLYLVDRGRAVLESALPALPENLACNAAYQYLGTAMVAALIVAVVLARKTAHRRSAWFFAGAGLAAVWLATGRTPLYDGAAMSLGIILKRTPGALLRNPYFLAQAAVLIAAAVWAILTIVARARRGAISTKGTITLLIVLPALAVGLLFLAPFEYLRRVVPVIYHVRSPVWFISCIIPFALGCGVATCLAILLGRIRTAALRGALIVAVMSACVFDALPYRREFRLFHKPEVVRAGAEVSNYLAGSQSEGRAMAADSYAPMVDLLISQSGRENAWGWLNWMSTAGTKAFMLDNVHRNLGKDQARAASLAGIASVRYLVSYLPDDGFSSQSLVLRKAVTAGQFAVYENALWRPFVQVYDAGAATWSPGTGACPAMRSDASAKVIIRRPGEITVEVSAETPALVAAAESFFPGWACRVDNVDTAVTPFAGAFLSTQVPAGRHTVTFSYHAPRIYYASYGASGAFVLFAVAVATLALIRRVRPRRAGARDTGGRA
jgi:hypothetical protein